MHGSTPPTKCLHVAKQCATWGNCAGSHNAATIFAPHAESSKLNRATGGRWKSTALSDALGELNGHRQDLVKVCGGRWSLVSEVRSAVWDLSPRASHFGSHTCCSSCQSCNTTSSMNLQCRWCPQGERIARNVCQRDGIPLPPFDAHHAQQQVREAPPQQPPQQPTEQQQPAAQRRCTSPLPWIKLLRSGK